MKIHIVASYFREFREHYYRQKRGEPSVEALAFERADWLHDLVTFGRALGHEVTLEISNDPVTQCRWAIEHGEDFTVEEFAVCRSNVKAFNESRDNSCLHWQESSRELAETITQRRARHLQPDVVWFANAFFPSRVTRTKIASLGAKLVVQCSQPLESAQPLLPHDLVVTISPVLLDRYRKWGIEARLFKYGFNPQINDRIGDVKRNNRIVFVGQLAEKHHLRRLYLSAIAASLPLDWYGPSRDLAFCDSNLQSVYRGEAFGLDMYRKLAGATIGWNFPPDFEPTMFGMFRTFEILGSGSVLTIPDTVVETRPLRAGEDFVRFGDTREMIDVCEDLLGDETKAQGIAASGHAAVEKHFHSFDSVAKVFDCLAGVWG